MTQKPHKPRKFLKVPHLSGGKSALNKMIRENLHYPEQAIEAGIQGDVIIKYKISDNGEVFDIAIVKGLGYGCDEEAKRLVMMLQYDPVTNRGKRVTANQKLKIPFRLPTKSTAQNINVVYTSEKKEKKPEITDKKSSGTSQVYNYSIKFNPDN